MILQLIQFFDAPVLDEPNEPETSARTSDSSDLITLSFGRPVEQRSHSLAVGHATPAAMGETLGTGVVRRLVGLVGLVLGIKG